VILRHAYYDTNLSHVLQYTHCVSLLLQWSVECISRYCSRVRMIVCYVTCTCVIFRRMRLLAKTHRFHRTQLCFTKVRLRHHHIAYCDLNFVSKHLIKRQDSPKPITHVPISTANDTVSLNWPNILHLASTYFRTHCQQRLILIVWISTCFCSGLLKWLQ